MPFYLLNIFLVESSSLISLKQVRPAWFRCGSGFFCGPDESPLHSWSSFCRLARCTPCLYIFLFMALTVPLESWSPEGSCTDQLINTPQFIFLSHNTHWLPEVGGRCSEVRRPHQPMRLICVKNADLCIK